MHKHAYKMLAGHLAEHLGSALLAQTHGPLSSGGVNHIHAEDESHGNAAGSAGKVYILGTNLRIPSPWLGLSDWSGPGLEDPFLNSSTITHRIHVWYIC